MWILISRELGYLQQAIYCFRKILYIDPQDLDALWDRSYLYKMQGDYKKAWIFSAFHPILVSIA